jgi:EAL domain-containing protein (putative c-di-GMP-specific phosphodiesterase class I)
MREPYRLPSGDAIVATASIGVAVATEGSRQASDLFREADLALYRAKDSGRDGYALFDDDLRARTVARVDAEHRLRRALEEGLLRLRYQPIVSLATGQIIGAEALVRLDDPERGLLPPSEFIEVAEETGQIVELDAVVLEESIRQLAEWSSLAEYGFQRIAVNITARSLEQVGFAERLDGLLQRYAVDGDLLRIELTERSLLASNPQVRASLEQIAALGVGIGLDDFGTGYSALAYLQNFSLHFLKVDRSFVSRLGDGPREAAIVGAIVDLAHAHALTVIAEGVETEEQLTALSAMGCDRGQGFFFSRPVPATELEALVRSRPSW